jgi:hypothetical protein
MKESEFKKLMGLARPDDTGYSTGYQRGLRRHYHGEQFGDPGEHQTWLAMAGHRQAQGSGYRDGVAGKPPRLDWTPQTSADRVSGHDNRMEAAGGRKLNGIRLKPAAAAALADMEADGQSATAIINYLLINACCP